MMRKISYISKICYLNGICNYIVVNKTFVFQLGLLKCNYNWEIAH